MATLLNLWTAFSGLGSLGLISGAGLMILVIFATAWLPGPIRRPVFGAGLAIFVLGGAYSLGHAKGAQAALRLSEARALEAEQTRAAIAARQHLADLEKAEADLSAERADNTKLKGLLDDVAKRLDASRIVLPRDIARRLRDL